MLVSWDWLGQYVKLDMPPAEVERRLMMAGLNHEETTQVDGDLAINLEVTSNRPDCLGHIGIAREVAVLWDRALAIPAARPAEQKTPVAKLAAVAIEAADLCPRYTARVIQGVKVGPSPDWLVRRLRTIGIAPINNIVDITNYVLMECGQPLHAFDLAKLAGAKIVVRRAKPDEEFVAINHKTYKLDADMCVIADAQRPVALGGVMGGADTEVSAATKNVLIESAAFDPLSIRNTARKLNLHSDSSYRFERPLDPEGVDWASRRACELILDLAGGELAQGVLDVGSKPSARGAVTLRFSQLKRILGIDVDPAEARRILKSLGNAEQRADAERVEVVPPSWRSDLAREADLVEEVARIHGYENIPEDVSVPMAPSHRTQRDRVLDKVRRVVLAAGYDEAMTLSAVDEAWSDAFSPWTSAPALVSSVPVLRRADRLRRSLVPSLLGARRTNESLSNPTIELFEIANVYLPQPAGQGLPSEELMLAVASGRDFLDVKGVIESIVANLNPQARVETEASRHDLLDADRSVQLHVRTADGKSELLGFLGEVSAAGLKQFELRTAATVGEIRIGALEQIAALTPKYARLSPYPAVTRDLNLVVDESVRWSDVAQTVQAAAAPHAESLEFKDVYRDPERIGAGKKSLLMTLTLRSSEGTLTNEEADRIREQVVAACRRAHQAELRA